MNVVGEESWRHKNRRCIKGVSLGALAVALEAEQAKTRPAPC